MAENYAENRAFQRFVIEGDAVLNVDGGETASVRLVEVSQQGCRIGDVADGPLAPGQLVNILVHESLILEASVRWYARGYAGLKLLRTLHQAELDAVIAINRISQAGARSARLIRVSA